MFYKKNINVSHIKDVYNFLYEHKKYSIRDCFYINDFTIANNVKVWNLDLKCDKNAALETIVYDNKFKHLVDSYLTAFEGTHPGYVVYFAGGYLLLSREVNDKIKSVLPSYLFAGMNYEQFKRYAKEEDNGVKYFKDELTEVFSVTRDFDKLCDELTQVLDEVTLEYQEKKKIEGEYKYAVIHSSVIDIFHYIEKSKDIELKNNLEEALDEYCSEEPFGYDFDEVRLIQIKEIERADHTIDTEITTLKYKGGYPESQLLV